MPRDAAAASVDPAEVARFSAMADAWWDPFGQFRPLHRLNPARIAYVRDRAAGRLGRDPLEPQPLAGLRVLDIGCGGGLLAEPMARLGATVAGIDAGAETIAIARSHAAVSRLTIDYRVATAEALAEAGERFDLVTNMEVVEHTADPAAFLAACCALIAPGGAMILSTLNRTPQAWAFAILGAEHLLGWLPRGTHDWRRFVRPSELAAHLRPHGARIVELAGLSYSLTTGRFARSDDLSVNYLALVERR
jgi:2-polyprenyl-6-hydroxyphenyl methylase/3-demethylubiquinone-9 3-methyltransferase